MSQIGIYATARRGDLTASDVLRLQQKYPRAGAQTLATMLGAPLTAVQALMVRPTSSPGQEPKRALSPAVAPASFPQRVEEPWPFNPAPKAVENIVRSFAKSRDLLLIDLVRPEKGSPHRMAERAMLTAVREIAEITWKRMSEIFDRDENGIRRDVKQYYERIFSVAA
jgi:hypothetical protein